MDFMELALRRESCRDFSKKPVEKEKLEAVMQAARLAPSACNSQPWSFTAVTGARTAKAVAKCLQGMGMNKFTDRCPAFIVVCEEKANLSAVVGGKFKHQHFAQTDTGIAIAYLCLAATVQGLSTCIIGWFDEEALRKLLNLNSGARVRAVIAIGYAREEKEPREKKRKPFAEIARFVQE